MHRDALLFSANLLVEARAGLVVQLVGLEPVTRRLWAAAMSDQLTLSNTRHSKLEEFLVQSWPPTEGQSRPLSRRY